MKVLVLGHSLVLSSNRQVWNTLGERAGIEVDLIVPRLWKSNLIKKIEFTADSETDKYIRNIYPLQCLFSGSGSLFIYNPFSLFKILRKNKYNVIIMNQETWSMNLLELNILKMMTKNIRTSFFLMIAQNIKKKHLYWLRFFERLNTRTVSSILYCCEEVKSVVAWKGIKKRCVYFPLSFDQEKYKKNSALKIENKKSIVLGYLGRLSEEKGLKVALDALKKVRGRGIDASFVIAGGGRLEEELKRTPHVKLLGIIAHTEAHKFYNEIDVFILPSETRKFWKEQFGRVIIESVAAGKPVIGSSSGAIPEVLKLIEMPYIFNERDAEDLASRVQDVFNDIQTGKINLIIEKSKKITFEMFSHKSFVDRILKCIGDNEIISKSTKKED